MTNQNSSAPSLYPILSVNFVGTLGFSIVLPFLIFLVVKYGGNAFIYGIMGATYSLFQLIGAPILGKWSDRYGRRKILLLSQLGTLLSWLIFLLAMYLPDKQLLLVDSATLGSFSLTLPLIILFVARALDGITGGNISVANAYLADISDNDKRSENFGKMAVSANLGFIVGPALAGLLGGTLLGEKLPVFVAIIISAGALVLIALTLKELKPKKIEVNPENPNVRKVIGNDHKECFNISCEHEITMFELLKKNNVLYLLSIYFLIFLGFNFFYIAFPIHAVKTLHWDLNNTGLFFAVLSLLMVVVQGPVLAGLSKKYEEGVLIIAGNIVLAVSFFLFSFKDNLSIYSGVVLMALGNGVMWPSLLSILSKSIEEKYQGRLQGISSSFGSFASIIGLLIGGVLYEQLKTVIFIMTGFVIFVVFAMSFKLIRIKPV